MPPSALRPTRMRAFHGLQCQCCGLADVLVPGAVEHHEARFEVRVARVAHPVLVRVELLEVGGFGADVGDVGLAVGIRVHEVGGQRRRIHAHGAREAKRRAVARLEEVGGEGVDRAAGGVRDLVHQEASARIGARAPVRGDVERSALVGARRERSAVARCELDLPALRRGVDAHAHAACRRRGSGDRDARSFERELRALPDVLALLAVHEEPRGRMGRRGERERTERDYEGIRTHRGVFGPRRGSLEELPARDGGGPPTGKRARKPRPYQVFVALESSSAIAARTARRMGALMRALVASKLGMSSARSRAASSSPPRRARPPRARGRGSRGAAPPRARTCARRRDAREAGRRQAMARQLDARTSAP